ncbi:hypothetical protein [Ensifer sp. ENS04]|uniref:hypothetical protein n=1 Tax=Ensifer sp. ENS04 TaxID=2769281 RepID=UPI001AEDB29D|nr:hypothetical protein [Ensifer sp. ENS04]
MVDDEGRSSLCADNGDLPSEVYQAAVEGDRAAIVELWHAGALDNQLWMLRSVLDDMLLENRIDMMMQVFSAPGREAA